VRNTILPLRAIFRRAYRGGDVAVNPTLKLTLPAVRSQRERGAAPAEVGPLLDALRAIYATALFAGLRLGELQALQWEEIDLDANLIHVRRSWDLGRHEEPLVQPPRPDHPDAPARAAQPLAQACRRRRAGLRLPQQAREQAVQPGTLTLHTRKAWATAGLTPNSRRSPPRPVSWTSFLHFPHLSWLSRELPDRTGGDERRVLQASDRDLMRTRHGSATGSYT